MPSKPTDATGRDCSPVTARGASGPTQGAVETTAGRFVKLPYEVLQRSDLTSTAKLVFGVLCDRIGANRTAWPGVRRLAKDCGVTRNTVVRTVRQLESAGLLLVDHVDGNPGGRTNTYRPAGTSSLWRRTQNDDVPKVGRRRPQNDDVNVPKMTTQPDKTNEPDPSRRERKSDAIWDAVCELFNLKPVTKRDRTRIGRIVSDLKAKGATPDDIRQRLARYCQAWPRVAATPESLTKHWDHFAQNRPDQSSPARIRTGSAEYEKCVERI